MTKQHEIASGNARQELSPNTVKAVSPPFSRHVAMGFTLVVCALVFIVPLCLLPGTALAAQWPLGSSRLSTSLGFHQTYAYAGGSYTHSGIDIEAAAGVAVCAPVAGMVSFVGQVPCGDTVAGVAASTSERTMTAVSIKIADGRTVTLMPFDTVDVERGQDVGEGQCVGALAATGDRSSQEPHLHMGLKRSGTYYDPMTLFGATSTTAQESVVQAGNAVGFSAAASDKATASSAATATEAAELPVSAPEGATAAASETVSAAQEADAGVADAGAGALATEESFGSITSGNVAWQPTATQESSLLSGFLAAIASLGDACRMQFGWLCEGLNHVAVATGVPVLVWGFCCATGMLSAAVLMAVGVMAAIRRVRQLHAPAEVKIPLANAQR